jgi:hypothetical protein
MITKKIKNSDVIETLSVHPQLKQKDILTASLCFECVCLIFVSKQDVLIFPFNFCVFGSLNARRSLLQINSLAYQHQLQLL